MYTGKYSLSSYDICRSIRLYYICTYVQVFQEVHETLVNIVTCRGLGMTKIRGSSSDDLIYWQLGYKFL
jgi:hypothetical protein